MVNTYISIISHNNDQMIIDNIELVSIAQQCKVIVKSNTPATIELIKHCEYYGIILINSDYGLGFGANNNYIYSYISSNFDLKANDYFLVMNPDVVITQTSLKTLISRATENNSEICAINLYRDKNFIEYDQSIKKFPSVITPLKAKIYKVREDIYNKDKIVTPIKVDWAAGSFLLFKASIYEALKGFDEKYFMYFEDVDLALRAKKKGIEITYYPNIKAIHFAAYQNRKIFSKNFLWYTTSFLRYHLKQI